MKYSHLQSWHNHLILMIHFTINIFVNMIFLTFQNINNNSKETWNTLFSRILNIDVDDTETHIWFWPPQMFSTITVSVLTLFFFG